MQFNFNVIKDLLGKVVYISGSNLPNSEPFVVTGYEHVDQFLQLQSLTSGKFLSGLHTSNVILATTEAVWVLSIQHIVLPVVVTIIQVVVIHVES